MKRHLIIGPIIIFVTWELIFSFKIIDPFFLPSPSVVIQELFSLVINSTIIIDFISTVVKVILACAMAIVIGVPLGLVFGRFEKIYRSLELVIDFFRSVPATAIFPLFLIIFGIGDGSKVAAAAFSSILIIIFNTAYGLMQASKSRILMAQTIGANKWQIFRLILFWESLPQTLIGLRTAVSLSLVIIVVTEMFIGTNHGLGQRIVDAQITYEIPTMYAIIILTGIVGYLFNSILFLIEKKFLHWSGR